MMTDELLNYLADCYLALNVRELLRVPFEQFLTTPNHFIALAARLHAGDGICLHDGQQSFVTLH